MAAAEWAAAGVVAASLLSWLWLVLARGRFWQTRPRLGGTDGPAGGPDSAWPDMTVVIPARNEAHVVARTLPSRLAQEYAGALKVLLVDDDSDDGTADVARRAARGPWENRLTSVAARPLPAGWTGKVWALAEGVRAGDGAGSGFFLFTDADILLAPRTTQTMVAKAVAEDLDLVSVMARLRAESWWERMLTPAFVYFFAKLYPFRWVGDPGRGTAAAAGGCTLVRRAALERAGGLERVAGELIDDCALAALVQRSGRAGGRPGRLWLGFDGGVRSERAYRGVGPVWRMVARSAFVQLRCSSLMLIGTVAGMMFLYAAPPAAGIGGALLLAAGWPGIAAASLTACGLAAWAVMAGSYVPALRWHGVSAVFAPLLPVTAMMYTLMTVDSARRHWIGKAGAWKGRTYSGLERERGAGSSPPG